MPVLGWSLFEMTPAVEQIGARAIAKETEDLTLAVDDNDRVIKCNETTDNGCCESVPPC